MHPFMTQMPWNSAPARHSAESARGPLLRDTTSAGHPEELASYGAEIRCGGDIMLGTQFDPTLGLSLSRQRHADLIAEAHQQQLVQEALDYAPRRTPQPEQAARGRVASRRTGLVLATLLRTMSFAVRGL